MLLIEPYDGLNIFERTLIMTYKHIFRGIQTLMHILKSMPTCKQVSRLITKSIQDHNLMPGKVIFSLKLICVSCTLNTDLRWQGMRQSAPCTRRRIHTCQCRLVCVCVYVHKQLVCKVAHGEDNATTIAAQHSGIALAIAVVK